jgi:UDP:flavonoid glycosyltransferase YjiC (YdhE family)
MVAIPIAYDQPGVAARIEHHGTGEFIEVYELTTDRLRALIEKDRPYAGATSTTSA